MMRAFRIPVPYPFDQISLEPLMRQRTRFVRLVHVATCSSTQDLATADAREHEGPCDDAVFVADHQASGRGRQQREWHDEPGSDLLVTFRFRQALPQPSALPAAIPAAVTLALEPFAETRLRIKWPNDLYLDGRKLCGILIDSGVTGPDSYLVGIGINCNRVRFPPDLEATATSLALATGETVDRATLLVALSERIDAAVRAIAAGDHDEPLEVFRDRFGLVGRNVEVTTNQVLRGRLTAIDFTRLVMDGGREVPLGIVRAIRG